MIGCPDGGTSTGKEIGSCKFDTPTSRSISIVETTTSLTLYEARSGREIGEVTVPSSPIFICPERMLVFDNDRPLQAAPGYEEYAKALGQYVNK